jgi:hypothetical protein
MECGGLTPLSRFGRLVGQTEPRPAARGIWMRQPTRQRQVACGKRGQVPALQNGCVFRCSFFHQFNVAGATRVALRYS